MTRKMMWHDLDVCASKPLRRLRPTIEALCFETQCITNNQLLQQDTHYFYQEHIRREHIHDDNAFMLRRLRLRIEDLRFRVQRITNDRLLHHHTDHPHQDPSI